MDLVFISAACSACPRPELAFAATVLNRARSVPGRLLHSGGAHGRERAQHLLHPEDPGLGTASSKLDGARLFIASSGNVAMYPVMKHDWDWDAAVRRDHAENPACPPWNLTSRTRQVGHVGPHKVGNRGKQPRIQTHGPATAARAIHEIPRSSSMTTTKNLNRKDASPALEGRQKGGSVLLQVLLAALSADPSQHGPSRVVPNRQRRTYWPKPRLASRIVRASFWVP